MSNGFNEGFKGSLSQTGGFRSGFSRSNIVISQGLMMYLDAGDAKSYPGSGATWKDLSGNGYNVTLYNSPTYGSANGGILTFAKASYQYGETATNLGNMPRWTVEVWAKLNSGLTAGQNPFVTNVYDGSNLNYSLGSNIPLSSNATAGFFDGAWRNATTGQTLSTGVWYHLAGTYDGATVSFYLNTVLKNTLSYVGTPTSGGNTRIARRWDALANDANNFVDGSIPVVRIYNRALSKEELDINFGLQRNRYGI